MCLRAHDPVLPVARVVDGRDEDRQMVSPEPRPTSLLSVLQVHPGQRPMAVPNGEEKVEGEQCARDLAQCRGTTLAVWP